MSGDAPERFSLTVPGGATLAAYRWRAADKGAQPGEVPMPRAPLVMVHGFGEHARRHAALANAAAAAGHDVFAFDQEGHGESPGARAVVAGYDRARAAVDALLGLVGGRAAPVLFGHSMGGAIALSYGLAHPERLAGLALSAPALVDAVKRPAWLLALSGPIARLVPTLPVAHLDVSRISRDPAEVERYRADPLIHHGGVPAVTGHTITTQGAALLARAGALRLPTLVVHGESDGVIDVDGSRRLATAVPAGTLTLHTFPGAYHEMHHDPVDSGVPQRVLAEFLAFLAQRSLTRGPAAAGT